jgi:hypothetical protein
MCKELQNMLLRELEHVGIRGAHFVATNGNHRRLVFSYGNTEHSLVLANTPSDRRAAANARAYLRRLLRTIGALRDRAPTIMQRRPKRRSREEITRDQLTVLKVLYRGSAVPPSRNDPGARD